MPQHIRLTRRNTGATYRAGKLGASDFRSWRASPSRRPGDPQRVRQAGLNEGLRSDGLTSSECDELNRLRRERTGCRAKSAILSRAAAWFATETGVALHRGSDS